MGRRIFDVVFFVWTVASVVICAREGAWLPFAINLAIGTLVFTSLLHPAPATATPVEAVATVPVVTCPPHKWMFDPAGGNICLQCKQKPG